MTDLHLLVDLYEDYFGVWTDLFCLLLLSSNLTTQLTTVSVASIHDNSLCINPSTKELFHKNLYGHVINNYLPPGAHR